MAGPPTELPEDALGTDERPADSTPLLAKMTLGLLTSMAGGAALLAIALVTLFGFFGVPFLLLYGFGAWWY